MAVDDIIKKISEDARSEAEALLSFARAEADAIREKAQRQAEQLRAEMTQKSEERAKEHAARIEMLATLEFRKEILREKKKLIEEALKKAENAIRDFAPDDYRSFLRFIILNGVESGNEEIISSAAHRDLLTPDFLNALNDELGPSKGNLRLSEETGDFSGGVILRDGKKETNVTIKTLIESERDKLEPFVANILFGESQKNG
jgi:V/A-type H+-transporting ATPase subunit E